MRFLLLLMLLVGCHSKSTTDFVNTAMGMPYRVTIGKPLSSKQKKVVAMLIDETFASIHSTENNWNPTSELAYLNSLSAGQRVVVTPSLYALLLQADAIHHLSGGRFDCTIEPVQRLWKLHLRQGTLPSDEELETLPVGWQRIHLEEGLFWKEDDGLMIDLSSIAKGACVDRLSEKLSQAGFRSHYVEWSGEIRTTGSHPEGRPWRIGITGGETVAMTDSAVATSGDSQQHWTVNETTYTHLIDPQTKRPVEVKEGSIASVSVQASSCAFADAIATTLMLFPSAEEAVEWADNIPEITVWVAYRR